jgi:hypothetical protein
VQRCGVRIWTQNAAVAVKTAPAALPKKNRDVIAGSSRFWLVSSLGIRHILKDNDWLTGKQEQEKYHDKI